MNFIRHNIKNKLLLLFCSALLIIVAAVYIGFSGMKNVIDQYSYTASHDVRYMAEVGALNVSFKTQVQEWKNTLIRGKNPEQLSKYWGSFNKLAEQIQQHYTALLKDMPADHPAHAKLAAFASSYPPMLRAYRQGYQAFVEADFDIAVADKSVKGIDREPTTSLNQAVEAVNQKIDSLSASMDQQAASSVLTANILLVVAIIGTCVLVQWFVTSRILQPLNTVAHTSRLIAKGDFTSDIRPSTRDQIGQVADNFNLIQRGLSQVLAGIIKDVNQLGQTITELTNSFSHFKGGIIKQIDETASLSANMQDMTASNHSVNKAITEANSFVHQSNALADQGKAMFAKNLQTSQSMLEAAIHAADIIASLKSDSDNIGNVVNVINSIAEQTNLLALNAAIEAARAGESGRGFAVVADEVRTLANKTQQSTKQISENINKLQSEADRAVQAMSQGKEQAQISLQQAQDSQQFVDKMHAAFDQITRLNQVIEREMEQQEKQTNNINKALQAIARQSDESQHGVQTMDQASQVLSKIFQHINSSTRDFKLGN